RRMIESNDGGANVSTNGGLTWTAQAYPTAQLYGIATTRDLPYHVCGSQQDYGSTCVSSGQGRAAASVSYSVGGGESGYLVAHPRNANGFYGGTYDGFVTRFDRSTGERRNIQPWPEKTMGHATPEITERFQWTSPI